jgi:hypothetical protein
MTIMCWIGELRDPDRVSIEPLAGSEAEAPLLHEVSITAAAHAARA